MIHLPRFLRTVLLLGLAARAGALRAQDPFPIEKPPVPAPGVGTTPPFEHLPETRLVAKQDGVAVRTDPGFVYREVRKLAKGEEIVADGRQGTWLHVQPEGWVSEGDHLPSEKAVDLLQKTLVVSGTSARVRATPSADGAVLRTLHAGDHLSATGPVDGWYLLADGGYVSATVVSAQASPRASAPRTSSSGSDESGRPVPWVVAADSAVARSGRGEKNGVVAKYVRGAVVPVTALVDGWAHVGDGWIRSDLLAPPAGAQLVDQGAESLVSPRRWSLQDLGGALIEVDELDPRRMVPALKQAMRQPGTLESDWTYLGLTIGMPQDSGRSLNFSPRNKIVAIDTQGQRYGNVFPVGPIERMPADVRPFFEKTTIEPGHRYEGLLLFRPTLKVKDIAEIQMAIGGKLQRLIPMP